MKQGQQRTHSVYTKISTICCKTKKMTSFREATSIFAGLWTNFENDDQGDVGNIFKCKQNNQENMIF